MIHQKIKKFTAMRMFSKSLSPIYIVLLVTAHEHWNCMVNDLKQNKNDCFQSQRKILYLFKCVLHSGACRKFSWGGYHSVAYGAICIW